MQYSKREGMKSEVSFLNSNHADICPRCTRRFTDVERRPGRGLLHYYRSLCKSTKCLVHQDASRSAVRLRNAAFHHNRRKRRRIPEAISTVCCRVPEFEEKQNSEDLDHQLLEKIESTVSDVDVPDQAPRFQDLISHGLTKEIIERTIIWPLKKPEIFMGLRRAPRGVLFFGPPGTGKTLIGKSIAIETKSTFFNISASSLMSKWIGESEKLVRMMFAVAKARQPSIIFIDEVDSILARRTPNENGCSRRMKNEFLLCMDGSATVPEDRIIIIGATNKPQDLDEAARQRFFKRLYIPLPDRKDRKDILVKLLENECHSLEEIHIEEIVRKTEGYSAADLKNVCQEAAMGPIKSLSPSAISNLRQEKIRPISMEDFWSAVSLIKPTVSKEELKTYEDWDLMYGYGGEFSRN